jgi:hypothetical protein
VANSYSKLGIDPYAMKHQGSPFCMISAAANF